MCGGYAGYRCGIISAGGAVVYANEFLFFPSFLAFSIFPVAPPITKYAMSYSDSLKEFVRLAVLGYFQICASPPVSSKS